MISKFKYLMLLIFMLVSIGVKSQEMLGLGFSNYSGISGKIINPAFLTGSKVYLDVNIAGVGIFLDNNFAYIPKDSTNIWSLLRGDSISSNYGPYRYNNFYTYYKNKPNYSFASVNTVMGPSLMIQDGKQAFGVGIAFRNYESSHNSPGQVLRALYNGVADTGVIGQNTNFQNLQFTSLSWNELSFNYAYDFYERYGNKLTAGIEMKILYGVEGFYTSIDDLKYHRIDKNHIQIDTLNATIGFALPVNYNNSTKANLNPWDKGHGVGFNIGIVYTKNKSTISVKGEKSLCAKPYEDYQYRIGLSIMDIGRIRFNRFSQLHQFNTGNISKEIKSLGDYQTINTSMRSLSYLIYGDSTLSLKDSTVFMSLPTALSLQFDFHSKKNFYLSGFWIQPLRFQNKSLRRPAQLAVIPRYETRLLGVSLPVSLYDYQKLRLGLAIRIYTLTIGTEKLGTLLGTSDLTGLDFYFNIKFNLLKGTCLSWKRGACQR